MTDPWIEKYISLEPSICGGKPCFKVDGRPTRIMIYLILELLEDGASYQDISRHYPQLTPEHIRAALHYAARITKNLEYIAFSQS